MPLMDEEANNKFEIFRIGEWSENAGKHNGGDCWGETTEDFLIEQLPERNERDKKEAASIKERREAAVAQREKMQKEIADLEEMFNADCSRE